MSLKQNIKEWFTDVKETILDEWEDFEWFQKLAWIIVSIVVSAISILFIGIFIMQPGIFLIIASVCIVFWAIYIVVEY